MVAIGLSFWVQYARTVRSVTLVEPKIAVEVNAQGKASWDFTPAADTAKPAAAPSS